MTILKKLWRIALLINILSLLEPLFSGNTNHLISYWISYGGVSAPFYVFFCLITTIKGKEREMKNELMSTSLFFFMLFLACIIGYFIGKIPDIIAVMVGIFMFAMSGMPFLEFHGRVLEEKEKGL